MGFKSYASFTPGSGTPAGCALEMVHSTSLSMREMPENHLLLPTLEKLLQSLCCETFSVAGLPGHVVRHFEPCLSVAKALSDVPL